MTPGQRDFVVTPAEPSPSQGLVAWARERAQAGRAGNTDGQSATRRQTIALCMIVRDEEAVIERCLDSVRELIDAWVICDTGSVDRTPERVRKALSGIPGALHRRPWRDFGHNRSELLELAAGSADYLLLLDADMTLRVEGPLPELTSDAYLLRHDGPLGYAVPRLIRADRNWWFEGSTHEHLATDGHFTQQVLDSLVVEHHGDGGHRAEKLERDAGLLERDLDQHPDDARKVFYLAQTYRDLGDEERAIELYRRRAELGGWDEEEFYALYQAGSLLGRREAAAALPLLISAWQRRPSRAEPLHELARICRFEGWHEAALTFAARGLEIAFPRDELFVHRWIYEWGTRYEYALAAVATGKREQARAVIGELLAVPTLPSDVEEYLRGLLGPVSRARGVPTLGDLLRAELAEIRLDVSPAWPQFNPTIAEHGDGYALIVRTANYRIGDRGRYEFLTEQSVIETLNYLVTLDRALEVQDVAPLIDAASGPRRHPSRIKGYEDCRLISLDGALLATATVRDRNPGELCEMALLTLDGAEISSANVFSGPSPGRHEKNWMPFVSGQDLHFLYSCGPTVVLRCDVRAGQVELVSQSPGPPGADRFRGGSQGLRVDDGYLFVIHEAADSDGARSYQHRFVLLDDAHRVAAVSRPFAFVSSEIEFCAGLARHGDRLLMTFGVGDHTAMLAAVDVGEALALLEAIPL